MRLRFARERTGFQQAELADMIGVHRNTVSNYERDKGAKKLGVLIAWSRATGVDLDWIVEGDSTVSQRYPDLALMPGRHYGRQPGRADTAQERGELAAAA